MDRSHGWGRFQSLDYKGQIADFAGSGIPDQKQDLLCALDLLHDTGIIFEARTVWLLIW